MNNVTNLTRGGGSPAAVVSLPCGCTSYQHPATTSLIAQPWMAQASHAPALRCMCGNYYGSLRLGKTFMAAG